MVSGAALLIERPRMLDEETLVEVRRENLRELARELKEKGQNLADVAGKDESYLSRIIGRNAKKAIGPDICRDIENKCGKARGWLDRVHGLNDKLLQMVADEVDTEARENKRTLTTKQRDSIIAVCYRLAANLQADRGTIRDVVRLAISS